MQGCCGLRLNLQNITIMGLALNRTLEKQLESIFRPGAKVLLKHRDLNRIMGYVFCEGVGLNKITRKDCVSFENMVMEMNP